MDVRPARLKPHRTQIDPDSPLWFGLPADVARTVHPYDEYELAVTTLGRRDRDPLEDDLFAGIRDRVGR